MSYILDAIRKAEQERQDKRSPGLHSIQASSVQTAARPATSWLPLVAALVLCLVAMNIAYWWWQGREATPAAEVVAAQVVPVEAEAPAPEPERALLDLWQAPANVKAAVSGLEFSFHVFSDTRSKRTIIINNRRKREGDKLTGDLVLKEITRTGVILRHPDADVSVSVIEGW